MARQEPSLLCLAQGHGLMQVTETKLSYRKPSTVQEELRPRTWQLIGPCMGAGVESSSPVHSFCIGMSHSQMSVHSGIA